MLRLWFLSKYHWPFSIGIKIGHRPFSVGVTNGQWPLTISQPCKIWIKGTVGSRLQVNAVNSNPPSLDNRTVTRSLNFFFESRIVMDGTVYHRNINWCRKNSILSQRFFPHQGVVSVVVGIFLFVGASVLAHNFQTNGGRNVRMSLNEMFLDASSHLYKRVCQSVRWSIGWSVGRGRWW